VFQFESDTILPASVEFDNRISASCTSEITSTNADTCKTEIEPFMDFDNRISASCTSEITNTNAGTCKTEVEPFTDDVEVLASTQDDTAVNVMVVKPFVVEMTSGTQWNDAESGDMEVESECNEFSSSPKLPGKRNQQIERGIQTNMRRGLERKKDEHFPKVRRSRKELQAYTSLESKVSQDGPTLKLKISRTKPASSTKVLSSQKLSTGESISGLEELLLPKQTRGRPPKRVYTSTSKEKSSAGSRQRRKSSSSVADESWTPSSKRSRISSVDPICDRYRELRDKNNEASRKSRQTRKARERELKEVATKLERENESLKIKADEMERLVKKLREALLKAVIKTKKV
jgi:hypothetical protein